MFPLHVLQRIRKTDELVQGNFQLEQWGIFQVYSPIAVLRRIAYTYPMEPVD